MTIDFVRGTSGHLPVFAVKTPEMRERRAAGRRTLDAIAKATARLQGSSLMRRRTFLKLLGGTAAANACTAGGVPPARVGDVAAGNESSLSDPSLSAVPGQPVCIGRDAKGIYAMTLICTHQGCDIGQEGTVSPSGLSCRCHGSQFDADGNVVRGPAPSPLAHFAVSADAAGNLTVDTSAEVDSGTRL